MTQIAHKILPKQRSLLSLTQAQKMGLSKDLVSGRPADRQLAHHRRVSNLAVPKLTAGPKVLCKLATGLNRSFLQGQAKRRGVDYEHLPVLVPVPMDIGGDELQPGHTSIRIHVEDNTRWSIAKKILRVGLWK